MIWDILLGVLVALGLLVLISLLMTGLTGIYRNLLLKHLEQRIGRPDLIPTLARFAAVMTIILCLAFVLLLRHTNSQ